MSNSYDTVVIGAGQAGLASAYYLQRAGSRFVGTRRRQSSWRVVAATVGHAAPVHPCSVQLAARSPIPRRALRVARQGRRREVPGGVCRAFRAAGAPEHPRVVAGEGRGSVRRHDGRGRIHCTFGHRCDWRVSPGIYSCVRQRLLTEPRTAALERVSESRCVAFGICPGGRRGQLGGPDRAGTCRIGPLHLAVGARHGLHPPTTAGARCVRRFGR